MNSINAFPHWIAQSTKKDNFCIPVWQKLPSKAHYLSYFTVSAELVELKGEKCGIGFATEKTICCY
jgi:hypothetical protein